MKDQMYSGRSSGFVGSSLFSISCVSLSCVSMACILLVCYDFKDFRVGQKKESCIKINTREFNGVLSTMYLPLYTNY